MKENETEELERLRKLVSPTSGDIWRRADEFDHVVGQRDAQRKLMYEQAEALDNLIGISIDICPLAITAAMRRIEGILREAACGQRSRNPTD